VGHYQVINDHKSVQLCSDVEHVAATTDALVHITHMASHKAVLQDNTHTDPFHG